MPRVLSSEKIQCHSLGCVRIATFRFFDLLSGGGGGGGGGVAVNATELRTRTDVVNTQQHEIQMNEMTRGTFHCRASDQFHDAANSRFTSLFSISRIHNLYTHLAVLFLTFLENYSIDIIKCNAAHNIFM